LIKGTRYLKGLIIHFLLLMINFFVFVGLIESLQFFTEELPILNALVLGFMIAHSFTLLIIQLGVQILEFLKRRAPTFLISYYFQFGDDETISVPILDPTQNRLGIIILLLVITGGPIFYPIFAGYGALVAFSLISRIGIDPVTIFERFLAWMPPIIVIVVIIIIVSIVAIEFKHA